MAKFNFNLKDQLVEGVAQKLLLVTNLESVFYLDVRLGVNALLIEPADDMRAKARVRGFKTSSCCEVFSMWIEAVEPLYCLSYSAARHGREIQVENCVFFAVLCDDDRDLCLDEFALGEYEALWTTLAFRAAQFWKGPNMPQPRWVPAVNVRWDLRIGR